MSDSVAGQVDAVRQHLELGIVGVLLAGDPCGAGFLIDPDHVVTCAHTVNEALGRSSREPTMPDEPVPVSFPWLDRSAEVRTRVVAWRPVGELRGDIAILHVEQAPPPSTNHVRLVQANDVAGHPFAVWGYPQPRAGEMYAEGVIQRRRGDDTIQIVATAAVGQGVRAGFSGAPVWDSVHQGVVGMVVAADRDSQSRTAYMLPTDVIAQVWSVPVHRPSIVTGRRRVVGDRVSASVDVFRDRVAFRARFSEMVSRRDRPVVAVTGRRGIGKSGLVARVLADYEEPDAHGADSVGGIVYLSTRTGVGVLDLARIFHAVARLLDDRERDNLEAIWSNAPADAVSELVSAIQERDIIVVLDNIDDLQDPDTGELCDDGVLGFLRCVCHAKRPPLVITTSQRPLRLEADLQHHVRSIELDEGLEVEEAVQLLRGLDDSGEAELKELPYDALATLVHRVHGSPRGLELLVQILANPTAAVDRLLESELAPEELLRALVTEGFSSLDDAGRDVVRLLALADTPVVADSIPAMLSHRHPAPTVRSTLERLATRRMVGYDKKTRSVRLHPLDSDFVRLALQDDRQLRDELDLALADWLAHQRLEPGNWRSSTDIAPQRREVRHRLRAGDVAGALRVIGEIAEFLARHGETDRLRRLVSAAVPPPADSEAGATRELATALAEMFGGSLELAIAGFARARDVAVPAGLSLLAASSSLWLGQAMRHAGRAAEALEHFERAAALQVTDEERRAVIRDSLSGTAMACCYLGRLDEAAEAITRFSAMLRPDDPAHLHGSVADVQSVVALRRGDLKMAREEADRGLELCAASAHVDVAGYLNNVRGLTFLSEGALANAEAEFSRTVEEAARIRYARLEGFAALNLAWTRLVGEDRSGSQSAATLANRRLAENGVREAGSARALRAAFDTDNEQSAIEWLRQAVASSLGNPDLYQPRPEELPKLAVTAVNVAGRR